MIVRQQTFAAIVAIALAGPAGATPGVVSQPAITDREKSPAGDGDRRDLAMYRAQVNRMVQQERRASGERQKGTVPETFGGAEAPMCGLMQPGSEAAPSRDCLACHAAGGRDNHPVDIEYERARFAAGSRLRPLAEVVARGILMPNGELRCVTCHDRSSPWKYRIALPPGAPARPTVNVRDPSTFERRRDAAVPMAPGSAVTPRPLCISCHAFD